MTASADKQHHCLILGAGICGLLAGTILKQNAIPVTILEKARGVGGRMSTRYEGDARFDHGAQFFTVRDQRFEQYVQSWKQAGVIREWFRRFPEESSEAGHPRYIGVRGINAVAKHLAKDLVVRLQETAVRLAWRDDHWEVATESGKIFNGSFLLMTMPVPQALQLLAASNIDLREEKVATLQQVEYQRSIAVMATLDGASGLPDFGGKKLRDGRIDWIADNQKKGVSPDAPAVTIHSNHEFAMEYWDADDSERVPLLLEEASDLLQSKVVSASSHRWRYTLPVNPLDAPYFLSRRHGLMLAGDSFGGPRIEGAALSGIQAGEHLLDFI